jgi:hypothetical protein
MKKQTIIASVILLSTSAVRAFDYGEVINRNKVDIGYNSIYSRAEEGHMDRLDKAKKQLARDIESYRKAHVKVMKSDTRVRELEANMPAHRAYASDWADGVTNIRKLR